MRQSVDGKRHFIGYSNGFVEELDSHDMKLIATHN